MKLDQLFSDAKEHLSFLGICFLIILVIFLLAKVSERMIHMPKNPKIRTRKIAVIGIFAAISGVLMSMEIPLWFAPPFYQLDFSELPVMICAFAYGPFAGVAAELCKVFIKLLLKGTSTAFIGDLANFIVGCTLILPTSIIYHIKKSKKAAVTGMCTGIVTMTVAGSFFNAIYLIPAFSNLFGMPLDAIVEMGTVVNSKITSVHTLVFYAVVPFNLLKGLVVSMITFLLYKPLSPMIHASSN
ncbi:MAG: ECF transporter S component [Clostridia bacterium]|nr:ECF transporter S component [Clostridia bacterium]